MEQLGLGFIGVGTIGGLRAEMARTHPAVGYLAVCDIREDRLREVAEASGADRSATDGAEIVSDPKVDAIFVSTSESAHVEPARLAIEAGKPCLVEKPLATSLEETQMLIDAAAAGGVPLYVGYTQRFRRRFLNAKQHIDAGYFGRIQSLAGSIFVTEAVGRAVITRAPTTSPVLNTLTYTIDLMLWFMQSQGAKPVKVYAQGARGAFYEEFGVHDSAWAVLTWDDGTVSSLGVSWEYPKGHPAYVGTQHFEVFGSVGSLSITDNHRDVMLVSTNPIPSPYTPDVLMNVALTQSYMPGDRVPGGFTGCRHHETFAFIRAVTTGFEDPVLAFGTDGRNVTVVAEAIDRALSEGQVLDISLPG
jgi:predicted dehydrogenase